MKGVDVLRVPRNPVVLFGNLHFSVVENAVPKVFVDFCKVDNFTDFQSICGVSHYRLQICKLRYLRPGSSTRSSHTFRQ